MSLWLGVFLLAGAAPAPLHVQGSKLFEDGQEVVLRGVSVPSLDSSNSGDHVFRSCRVAVEDWKANCILLPVSQDRWFGKAPEQRGSGDEYRNEIEEIASYLSRSNAYLILSLSWSDGGQWSQNLGPHKMPDSISVQFWKEAAHKFRGNDKVIFDLYDSPHDVDGGTWLNGGAVEEGALRYQAVGFQELLNAVRSVGGKNVALVCQVGKAQGLKDSEGRGLLIDLAAGAPVDIRHPIDGSTASLAEFQYSASPSDPSPVQQFDWLHVRQLHGEHLSWIARSMSTLGRSALIADWSYSPSPLWGAAVKAELATTN